MQSAAFTGSSNHAEVMSMGAAELARLVQSQAETITSLQQQLEWFRRQIFGAKSERFAPEPDHTQMHLGEALSVPAQPPEQRKTIPAHTRRVAPCVRLVVAFNFIHGKAAAQSDAAGVRSSWLVLLSMEDRARGQ
jgi:hypothetical protein